MRASSSVGLGLSLVFGCLLLALVAELYYLLWWKKTVTNRDMIQQSYNNPSREFFYMFCWKKPSSLTSTSLTTDTQVHEPHQLLHHHHHHHQNMNIFVRPFAEEQVNDTIIDSEQLMMQNLFVPPRFLFTITEETKEDLESEDVSKIESRRMSDVISLDTPFFTPLASPAYFTPPITPADYSYRTFSPLFQSSSDLEFHRIWASPPPKFKFLRDAEDKLQRKMMKRFEGDHDHDHDHNHNHDHDDGCDVDVIKDEESGSFITLNVSKNKEMKG